MSRIGSIEVLEHEPDPLRRDTRGRWGRRHRPPAGSRAAPRPSPRSGTCTPPRANPARHRAPAGDPASWETCASSSRIREPLFAEPDRRCGRVAGNLRRERLVDERLGIGCAQCRSSPGSASPSSSARGHARCLLPRLGGRLGAEERRHVLLLGVVIPSRRTTVRIIFTRTSVSMRRSCSSTYSRSSTKRWSHSMALRPLTWASPVMPGRTSCRRACYGVSRGRNSTSRAAARRDSCRP